MIISAIVAMNAEGIIGLNNQIPWHLSSDLKFFKKTTTGHHILMGRKCYESIGMPLPNRTNIVITRDPYFIVSNCLIAHSIEEGISIAKSNQETELFIIGGGEIYNQSMYLCDQLYVTLVDYNGRGDVYFPKIDLNEWKLVHEENHLASDKNPYQHKFQWYKRK
ncbi:MAG: dihydrofolate reductase [Saprospiraceae bacterium]|nr:dihydrofolate reductase [Candidatus Defluviibacterium haderslevense]